ncbi:MAG: hypothetical protein KZQ80_14415 [Candidatus Thiodiazotropha sp. (ex Monitilora ramsayi)]|nr:hypothetical protein [Candidatus Thiodiazotropha sp. (ex Monitilora ramsayi)]
MSVSNGDTSYPVDKSFDLRDLSINNRTVYITSQCYTKTQDGVGSTHNPCFTCHIPPTTPNFLNDSDLQTTLSFPEQALTNPFSNLFEDRTSRISAISDAEILDYVATDNYKSEDGEIMLAQLLASELPDNWDIDGDKHWDGYIPDCQFNFDDEGFDRKPNKNYTGWRAFGYYPFPGTFWPTNGSTDDVMIRLDAPFQQDINGDFELEVYKLNLSIVESLVKQRDITISPVEEAQYLVDLNDNGIFDTASVIVHKPENNGSDMSYVGRAGLLQQAGELPIASGLYPLGTEFLHSVRYLQPMDDSSITLANRMKELRYARKETWYTYGELWQVADREAAERTLDDDAVRAVVGDLERGMRDQGWRYQGFIEDRNGHLRPQSQEESFFCMGCHFGTGATTDTVFSFTRKFDHDSFHQGWYHWSQSGLRGIPEPIRSDGQFEYSHYLAQNGAGDEFRNNEEIISRFFNPNGSLVTAEIDALHDDISRLLLPSRTRALKLNKAYRSIVEDQDFPLGRDANITPVDNVYKSVIRNQPTGILMPIEGPGLIQIP